MKSLKRDFACFIAAISLSFFATQSSGKLISDATQTKTLVLLDNWATKETHSIFFNHLANTIGHELEFVMAKDGPHSVKHYDQYYYDNILLMAPSIKGKSTQSSTNSFQQRMRSLRVSMWTI